MSMLNKRKFKPLRLVINSKNNERIDHHHHQESKLNTCDIDNHEPDSKRRPKRTITTTMKSIRRVFKPTLATNVKIFILVSIVANLYSHLLIDQPLLLKAEAGSKSSKASSKTTVIAIDGGGSGGGHGHPMPVPWPVVHCHHHHHHLKYVPKPILIHHWVKKQKAPMLEIASSDKHNLETELETDSHAIEQSQTHHEYINPMALPSSLPETYNSIDNGLSTGADEFGESNRLLPGLSSVFDDHRNNHALSHQKQQSMQFPHTVITRENSTDGNPLSSAQRSASKARVLPPSIGTELEKELKGLQTRKKLLHNAGDDNSTTNKHLKKVTSKIISSDILNPKKHFGGDVDLEDSYTNIAVSNSSANQSQSLGKLPNLPPNNAWGAGTGDKMANRSSGGGSMVEPSRFFSLKPIMDIASAKLRPRRGNFGLNDFWTNLEMANRMEQSQSSRLYERVASEQQGRMQALNAVNPWLLTGSRHPQHQPMFNQLQSPQQVAPLQVGGKQIRPYNYESTQSISKRPGALMMNNNNAIISSKVANVLSESRTIEAMIKLAEQMARNEAKRILAEQQRKLAMSKTVARNEPIASRGLLKSLNLFGILQQPSSGHHHRNRQRRDSSAPAPKLYNEAFHNLRIGSLQARSMSPKFIQEPKEVLRSFNLDTRPTARFGHRIEVPGRISRLMSKHYGGDQMLTQPSNSVSKNIVKRAEEMNRSPNDKSKTPDATEDQVKPTLLTVKPVDPQQEEPNLQTTMSPIQENEFYIGQRKHLMKSNRQQQALPSLTSSIDQTRVYNSLPSDLHNFIVDPPSSQHSTDSVQSVNSNEADLTDNSGTTRNQSEGGFTLPQQPAQQSSQVQMTQVSPMQQWAQATQMKYTPFTENNFIWKQPRNLRSVSEVPSVVQSLLGDTAQGSNPPSAVTTSEGGRLYQNFAENFIPMPSYLEFPMSPQFWSAEAMKSVNGPSFGGSNDSSTSVGLEENSGLDQDKMADSSQLDSYDASTTHDIRSNQQEAIYDGSNNQLGLPIEHKIVFEPLLPSTENAPHYHPNLFGNPPQYQFDQMAGASVLQHEQQQQPIFGPNPPSYLNFGEHSPEMQVSSASSSGPEPSFMFRNPSAVGLPQHSSLYPVMSQPFATKPNKSAENGELMQASLSGGSAFQGRYPNSNPSGGLNQQQQYDPMEVATADMKQLSQFQNTLSQTAGQANNLTSMTRFSRQIRDQMRTLQGRLPQMPQIPNIPQPPNIPNLPMPPGMMQMAGLALPFAMARATRQANRVRDQQVNAAANAGGTTAPGPGQRIFNRALTLTNRLSRPRPRPRPSSAPAASSSSGSSYPTKNRNRFLGLVQTVVDMSRRPSSGLTIPSVSQGHRLFGGATSSLTKGPKLRPKVDEAGVSGGEVRAKRLGRAAGRSSDPHLAPSMMFNSKRTGNKQLKSAIIMPGSVLSTVNDGSLARFASMTSPVDMLAEQLARRERHLREHHETHGESNNFDIIDERPIRASHEPLLNGLLPVPVVANNFNLLMFTAQNVTGHLMKPQEVSNDTGSDQQQHQPQADASPSDGGAATGEGISDPNSVQQDSKQSNEHEKNGLEPQIQDQGQSSAASMESYGERAPRPVDRFQQSSGSQKLSVTERPVASIERAQLSQFTANGKSHDKMEPSVQKTSVSSISEADQQEQQKPEASVFTHVMQPLKDSFRPAGGSRVTTTDSSIGQLMPMIPMTHFEPFAARSTVAPNSKWEKDMSNGSSRFNKTKKFTARPVEHQAQQQHPEINTDTRSAEPSNGKESTPVVQAVIQNSATPDAVITNASASTTTPTTTTDRPTLGTSVPPPDDYVRAIKLVRGVAYPWPPPTMSSKQPGL